MTPSTIFPPAPNAATYPAQPTLNLFAVDDAPSPAFDETQPYKTWVMTPGFIPASWTSVTPPTAHDDVILDHFDGLGRQRPFVVNYGVACGPRNVAPAGASAEQIAIWQAAPYGQQALPVPVRPLLSSETVTEALGIITIHNSAYVPSGPSTTTDAQKLAAIRAILAS